MDGTNPRTDPTPIATPRRSRKRLLLILLVAVAIVAAGISVYVLTPIPLMISDGSTAAAIRGNLKSVSSTAPLEYYFNATTYANQSQGASSSLTLQLVVDGWFVAAPPSVPAAGFWLMYISMTALGHFAANLNPTGLTLTCNGTNGTGARIHVDSLDSYLTGTNVSFDANQLAAFVNQGSATVSATPLSQGGGRAYNVFTFSDTWRIDEYRSYNGSYGFSATVTGGFTPAVRVGILLQIIDVSA